MNKKTRFTPLHINKKLILVAFMFGLLSYLVGMMYINQHEFNHWKIYDRYEIVSNVSIDYKTLSGVVLIKPEDKPNCNDYCRLAHGLNDIIGGYTRVFIFNLWTLFIAWLVYKRVYENDGKRNEKAK